MTTDNSSYQPTSTVKESYPAREFQASTIWRSIKTNKWLIIGLGLAGMLIAIAVGFHSHKLYTAVATVEISRPFDSTVAVKSLSGTPQQFGSNDEMLATLLTLQTELQSARVGLRVIDAMDLSSLPAYSDRSATQSNQHNAQDKALVVFEDRMKVSLVKDTTLIQISFTDSDPNRAAAVANEVVKAYNDTYSQARSAASDAASGLLSVQLADLRREVIESERNVDAYKEKTGIVDEDSPGGSTPQPSTDGVEVARFVELNRELTDAQVVRVQKEAMFRMTEAGDGLNPSGVAVRREEDGTKGMSVANESPEYSILSSLHQQRVQIAMQIASRSGTLGSKSPEMKQWNAELAEIDQQTAKEMKRLHARAFEELRLARATESGLLQLIDQQQHAVTQLNVKSNQLRLLEEEARSKRALYQDLSARLQEARVSNGVDSSTITEVDPARAPVKPSSPKIARNAVTGLVFGCLLGAFIGFLRATPAVLVLLFFCLFPLSLRAQTFPNVLANVDQTPQKEARPLLPSPNTLVNVSGGLSRSPLEPGYLLHLEVFQVPELSADVRVDGQGDITLPPIGSVHVQGLTVEAAQALLKKTYEASSILVDPQIVLTVLQYSTIPVTVLGQVQTPGVVQLIAPSNLLDAVAAAGGETTLAGSKITLERPGEAPITFNYNADDNGEALRGVQVQGNDAVHVGKAGIVYVLGAVTRPGGYLMVHDGTLNVLEAVSLSQGATLVASLGTVYVIRPKGDGQFTTIPIPYKSIERGQTAAVALRANDVLYIPTSKTKVFLIDGAGLLAAAATSAVYAYRAP